METAHAPVAPEASLKVFVFSRRSGNTADAGRALETLTLWKMCGRSRIHTSSYGIPLKINGDTDTADEEQQPEHRDVTPPQTVVSANSAVAMATAAGSTRARFTSRFLGQVSVAVGGRGGCERPE